MRPENSPALEQALKEVRIAAAIGSDEDLLRAWKRYEEVTQ